MRIAIIDPASWSLAYDAPLGAALAKAGCEVTLYCTRSPHGAEVMSQTNGFSVDESFYRLGYRPSILPRRVGRALQHPFDLSKLIRRLRSTTDVVMVQWLPGRSVDARGWAGLAKEIPVTFTAHNAQERDNKLNPDLLRGFSAVIAHSQGGSEHLKQAGLKTVWRMRIGAYTQYAQTPDPPELPLDIPDDAPLVVLPGLLRDYKGVDVLLAAWPMVQRSVPEAHLAIAGRPMGVTLPTGNAIPKNATILPRFVSEQELGWLLRRATICCLPYRRIDMSGIAAAALACKSALVLSDVGGFSEYVGNGGLTVPPNDPDALAHQLIAVLTDHSLQNHLVNEAETAIRTTYSWDAISLEYVERLKLLISSSAQR